jgi:hypothetical protein
MDLSVLAHVIPTIIPGYSAFISSLLKPPPIDPGLSSLYRDCLQWVLQIEDDPTRISFIVLALLENLERLFCDSPDMELAYAVVDILRVRCPDCDPMFRLSS